MSPFRLEPILWIHVAGLATLPMLLGLCLLGFSVGEPVLPVWLELLLVAAIGTVPVLWMQLTCPFYIFAILAVALKLDRLTSQQRQILSLINTRANRLLSALAAVFLIAVLWQLYRVAPMAAVASLLPEWRVLGLLLAGVAFLLSNVFLQIPVSVLRVFVTSDAKFAATEPYALERIPQDFTIVGLQVNQILPWLTGIKTEE